MLVATVGVTPTSFGVALAVWRRRGGEGGLPDAKGHPCNSKQGGWGSPYIETQNKENGQDGIVHKTPQVFFLNGERRIYPDA